VTKAGSNNIHGWLLEFLGNDGLNANSWNATSKPPLRRNQFGGSFGGPLVRNRLFYFGSYSGLRQRKTDFSNTAIVPTAAERLGDFSASRIKPNDPATGLPFNGGIILNDRLDPTALNVLKAAIPFANLPNNFYQATVPHPSNTDEVQFKIDQNLSALHQLTGSYYRTSGEDIEGFQTPVPTGALPWSRRTFQWTQQNINVSDVWTVSPTLFNQLRLTYVRDFGGRNNSPVKSLADFGSKFQVQGIPALPDITVNGYFRLAQAIAGPVAGSNYYGLRELLGWNNGHHLLKLGIEFSLEKNILGTLLNNYGTFSFDG